MLSKESLLYYVNRNSFVTPVTEFEDNVNIIMIHVCINRELIILAH